MSAGVVGVSKALQACSLWPVGIGDGDTDELPSAYLGQQLSSQWCCSCCHTAIVFATSTSVSLAHAKGLDSTLIFSTLGLQLISEQFLRD